MKPTMALSGENFVISEIQGFKPKGGFNKTTDGCCQAENRSTWEGWSESLSVGPSTIFSLVLEGLVGLTK